MPKHANVPITSIESIVTSITHWCKTVQRTLNSAIIGRAQKEKTLMDALISDLSDRNSREA
jgi:hypothetical protein